MRTLGRPLPTELERFLRSWDGAELFQESVRIYGLDNVLGSLLRANTSDRPAGLLPTDLVFGDTAAGELLVLDAQERVVRLRGLDDDEDTRAAESGWQPRWDERWFSGSTLENWLAATVTHELPLYDSEGEFVLEAFEEDGLALVPSFALKLARKVLRKDPASAELHHALGVAQRRNGKVDEASLSFEQAAQLDPGNSWIWFDLGRSLLEQDAWPAAAAAFGHAAAHSSERPLQAARFCVWQACAWKQDANEPMRAAAASEALRLSPTLQADLQKAATAAVADDDTDAYAQIAPLLDAFVAVQATSKRLSLFSELPAPPQPQKPLPRPVRAKKPPPEKRLAATRTKTKAPVRPKPKR